MGMILAIEGVCNGWWRKAGVLWVDFWKIPIFFFFFFCIHDFILFLFVHHYIRRLGREDRLKAYKFAGGFDTIAANISLPFQSETKSRKDLMLWNEIE